MDIKTSNIHTLLPEFASVLCMLMNDCSRHKSGCFLFFCNTYIEKHIVAKNGKMLICESIYTLNKSGYVTCWPNSWSFFIFKFLWLFESVNLSVRVVILVSTGRSSASVGSPLLQILSHLNGRIVGGRSLPAEEGSSPLWLQTFDLFTWVDQHKWEIMEIMCPDHRF